MQSSCLENSTLIHSWSLFNKIQQQKHFAEETTLFILTACCHIYVKLSFPLYFTRYNYYSTLEVMFRNGDDGTFKRSVTTIQN